MLYSGDKESYSSRIVHDEEDEVKFREIGLVDYVDLPEPNKLTSETMGSAASEDFKNAFVTVEQFDAVSEELIRKETQLGAALGERDFYIKENEDIKLKLESLGRLHDGVLLELDNQLKEYLKLADVAKNAELKHAEFFNNIDAMKERIAEMQGDTTPVGTVSYAVDYNSMTADQLRALLDERGIKYLVRDSKDTLIALLEKPKNTEE